MPVYEIDRYPAEGKMVVSIEADDLQDLINKLAAENLLSYADLSNRDLRRISFPRGPITNTNFSESLMNHCAAHQTIFKNCNFENADWTGSNMSFNTFESCRVKGLSIDDVTFSYSHFVDIDFTDFDFSVLKEHEERVPYTPPPGLPTHEIVRDSLRSCTFTNVIFKNANLARQKMEFCKFKQTDMAAAKMEYASVRGSRFEFVNFRDTFIERTDFSESLFLGVVNIDEADSGPEGPYNVPNHSSFGAWARDRLNDYFEWSSQRWLDRISKQPSRCGTTPPFPVESNPRHQKPIGSGAKLAAA